MAPDSGPYPTGEVAYHKQSTPVSVDAGTTFYIESTDSENTGNCTASVATVQGSSDAVTSWIEGHFSLGKNISGATYIVASVSGESPTLIYHLGSDYGLPVWGDGSCSSSASIKKVSLLVTEVTGDVKSTYSLLANQDPSFPYAEDWSGNLLTGVGGPGSNITVEPAEKLGPFNCYVTLGILTGDEAALELAWESFGVMDASAAAQGFILTGAVENTHDLAARH
jgi:hypothetical protein